MIVPFALHEAATTTTASASALDELRRRRELIRRIAALNRLGDVAVFGSVARGEETSASDLDLLVTPSAEASLFDVAQFFAVVQEIARRRAPRTLEIRGSDRSDCDNLLHNSKVPAQKQAGGQTDGRNWLVP